MANDPAFLFYPGDYLRDTQCLSEGAQVAYDRIMCEHMRNICISHKQLNFFTKRLTDEQKDELLMVLTETKEGFQIKWVAESILKRKAYSESRRKNRSGKTKTYDNDMNNISKTYVEHMENENENENENEIKNVIENAKSIKKKSEPKSLIPENFPFKSSEAIKAMEDYIHHRRQLKVKPYTQKGLEIAMKEWSRWGEAMFIEAVYNSIRNNYQGIFPPNSNKNNETKTTQATGQQQSRPSNKFEAEQQRKQGLAALLERNKRILNGYAESEPYGSDGNQQESEQYSDYLIIEERRGGGGDDGEGKLIDNGGGSSAEHR